MQCYVNRWSSNQRHIDALNFNTHLSFVLSRFLSFICYVLGDLLHELAIKARFDINRLKIQIV
jgi:hypothetical protein